MALLLADGVAEMPGKEKQPFNLATLNQAHIKIMRNGRQGEDLSQIADRVMIISLSNTHWGNTGSEKGSQNLDKGIIPAQATL